MMVTMLIMMESLLPPTLPFTSKDHMGVPREAMNACVSPTYELRLCVSFFTYLHAQIMHVSCMNCPRYSLKSVALLPSYSAKLWFSLSSDSTHSRQPCSRKWVLWTICYTPGSKWYIANFPLPSVSDFQVCTSCNNMSTNRTQRIIKPCIRLSNKFGRFFLHQKIWLKITPKLINDVTLVVAYNLLPLLDFVYTISPEIRGSVSKEIYSLFSRCSSFQGSTSHVVRYAAKKMIICRREIWWV